MLHMVNLNGCRLWSDERGSSLHRGGIENQRNPSRGAGGGFGASIAGLGYSAGEHTVVLGGAGGWACSVLLRRQLKSQLRAAEKRIIEAISKCKQPDDATFQKLIQPLADVIVKDNVLTERKSMQRNSDSIIRHKCYLCQYKRLNQGHVNLRSMGKRGRMVCAFTSTEIWSKLHKDRKHSHGS
ncbi:hypothetical protein O6H91_Y312200 [Diphasiastrum complanatum]|nr:hypothetical protein O6H91_Y312200 [Diphasiastrum complanatum]